uniref:Uncharacterized protein n=1 Tax=Leptocylindrus danicus TaxID=163516 RepID=A0A7S2PT13_9STRA|mmetsp:Transcript_9777/g.14674  ORF Transcript_9777/g.14674 Transcript_9777/m.14674 type:complete len:114 (+) Transcript_9777:182-523(+)
MQTLGAFYNIAADYCPMRETLLSVDCTNDQQESHFAFDAYSANSRCFETVGIKKSVCVQASCSPTTGKIEGFLLNLNASFVCEYEGQIIDYTVEPPNESFQFICPRAAQFCEE